MKAIAAMSLNKVIGRNGIIPWYLPEDFKWFKKMTVGGTVIMGRATFQSLKSPLKDRINIVVSSTTEFSNVTTVKSLSDISESLLAEDTTWIIGGAKIYSQMLPKCTDLYLSIVKDHISGDTHFPLFEHLFDRGVVIEDYPDFKIVHYKNKSL